MDTVILPAGKYLVGDFCYRDIDIWDQMIDNIDGNVHNLKDGRKYVILHTKHGDGRYFDFDLNEYWVDSGTIGIMQWEGEDMQRTMERTFNFNSDFTVFESDGDLHFGAVVIETNVKDYDEKEYDLEETFL